MKSKVAGSGFDIFFSSERMAFDKDTIFFNPFCKVVLIIEFSCPTESFSDFPEIK